MMEENTSHEVVKRLLENSVCLDIPDLLPPEPKEGEFDDIIAQFLYIYHTYNKEVVHSLEEAGWAPLRTIQDVDDEKKQAMEQRNQDYANGEQHGSKKSELVIRSWADKLLLQIRMLSAMAEQHERGMVDAEEVAPHALQQARDMTTVLLRLGEGSIPEAFNTPLGSW